ncbi:acyl-CoA dehydrogenase family protein [Sphingosinicella ginsenosidimutans]|uniref:Pimeloyl-CoA dehydrogenase large subunit n=1 Tax=Allosphingosinicella ginsenosidimutans TaxID=1176539 RepID=A0A5C6TQG4_9SPHN|nr:acyl-CoA dehydrogenase family protein [Sphingosinicella ginsenosidimutans]TXC62583.1 pimeloyl-CoA dehydrogenase large subunit [Sphingosinicella ginsenosidimutans]
MNLGYTTEELEFARMVSEWVAANLPAEIARKTYAGERFSREEYLIWPHILRSRGWSMPSWPKEHGGPGWTLTQRHLFTEITTVAGAPYIRSAPEKLVGPLLMAVGTPEQKAYYLPRILNFEDHWSQGLSEPGGGSDLTALKTRADRDGNHFVINGSKIWTSDAHNSTLILALVRTDQSQKGARGLTQLIIPTDAPGVTIRPILHMSGEHHFNQVFFDDVRVPVENVVGTENGAWQETRTLLAHERFNFARLGESKRHLTRLKALARSEMDGPVPMIARPDFRRRIAQAEIALDTLEVTTLRLLDAEQNGRPLGGAPNIVKLKGAEVEQEMLRLIADVIGPYGTAFDVRTRITGSDAPAQAARRAGKALAAWLESRTFSIAGGSSEVQHNMFARHELGLGNA